MIHKDLKALIDKYCMGIQPTDAQLDKIFDKVAEVSADPMEVDAYMKEMQAGPTKEQRAAEEAARRKVEEEARKRKAAEEAAKRKAEEKERKLREKKEREEEERKNAERKARLEEARIKAEAEKKAAEAKKEKMVFATTRKKNIKRLFFWGIGIPLLVLAIGVFFHLSWVSAVFITSLIGGIINFNCAVITVSNDTDSKTMQELKNLYAFIHLCILGLDVIALIVCIVVYCLGLILS